MTGVKLTPCPDCGAPRPAGAHRCARCGWRSAASTKRTRPDLRRTEWHNRSGDTLDAWRAEHGDWCPGWPPSGHPPHATADLTCHHVTEDPDGPLAVLCRSENARLGRPAGAGAAR
jgi:5-methylcytosine-specific restriction protein A